MLNIKLDKEIISGFNIKYSVKERIFLYYMFFFAFLSAFTIVLNILYGLNFSFNYKWIIIFFFSIIMMIFSLKQQKIKLIHRIGTYSFVIIILPASWLASAGLASPSIIYSLLIMILINYLIRGWERICLNIINILINIGLIGIYGLYPEVYKHMTHNEQFNDWIVNVPIVFVFISILLITFENAYETERIINNKKSEDLKHLSQIDTLTKLYNRATLKEKLSLVHKAYIRTNFPYSIIMVDVDYFKSYNDLYGYMEGDKCLQAIGSLLKRRINRNTDWAYRYGGEEFLILLGFTDKKGAGIVADQIKKDLEKIEILHEGSKINNYVTVSMGIATVWEQSQKPESIILYADTALYQSKSKGRNGFTQFEKPKAETDAISK